MSAENMRHSIMNAVRVNNLKVTGDFWLMLVFRTEDELKKICRDLSIKHD